MKKAFVLALLGGALALPAGAVAQPAPPSPSPEMRSLMEKVHGDARAAAYAALTPAHATAVRALTAQVAAGTLERRAAVQQIDALLSPDEQKNVLAAAERSRRAMFEATSAAGGGPMMDRGPRPGGPPPGGPQAGGPPMGGPPPGGPPGPDAGARMGGPPGTGGAGAGARRRSPGRYLLMVSMSPEQMRRLAPRARSSSAP